VQLRDLLTNPDPERGHMMRDFFTEGPASFIWIYKMGQARCTFLEETYGEGFIQRVLEQAPTLIAGRGMGDDFPRLLERLTGDAALVISEKFDAWIKRRAFAGYLEAGQDRSTFPGIPLDGIILELDSAPDGDLLMVKRIDPYTGQSRLALVDPRAPREEKLVIEDGVPGYESLHPIGGRNFDLGNGQLVFAASQLGRDVIHVQSLDHEVKSTAAELARREEYLRQQQLVAGVSPRAQALSPWDVDFKMGKRRAFKLGPHGLIGALSPAFSPDGKQVVFIGLDAKGVRDLFLLTPGEGDAFTLVRLTHDPFAERELVWGKDGIVFTSDATGHGRYNLFRVDPLQPEKKVRLTSEARDHSKPVVLSDGRVFFVAHAEGHADIHEVKDGGVIRRTQVATGFADLTTGPAMGMWTLLLHGGRNQVARVTHAQLEPRYAESPQPDGADPTAMPLASLQAAQSYQEFAPRNWEMGTLFALIGGGSQGIAGQVMASATDRLRNHALLLTLAMFGSLDVAEGQLLYLNQERRATYGLGPVQLLQQRLDSSLGSDFPQFVSLERLRGAMGLVRYPLHPFLYVEGSLAAGAVEYLLDAGTTFALSVPEYNGRGDFLPLWMERKPPSTLQMQPSIAFGYDTLRHHVLSGPVDGTSVLLELSASLRPFVNDFYSANVRLDATRFFPIAGRTRLFTHLGAGTAMGKRLANQFYLSSFDTLRGVPFGDSNWLLGRNYLYATAELRIPLDVIIQVAFLSRIEGIAGVDAGGVGANYQAMWDNRVLDVALGFNLAFGPLMFRVHFARPFNVRAARGMPVADGQWVPNVSLKLAGFDSYL
jgi:hypothetical protein